MTILLEDGLVEYLRAGELGAAIGFGFPISVWAPDGKIYWLTNYVLEQPALRDVTVGPALAIEDPRPVIRIDGNHQLPGRQGGQRYGRSMRTSFRVPLDAPIPIIRHRKAQP